MCSIAGVDVGGMTPGHARAVLDERSKALADDPVTFRVGSHTWNLEPRHLGVRVDWTAAVDAVRRQGNGFGPLRGFRRLDMRFFGADVAPPTQVYDAALRAKLDEIEAAVNVAHRDASITLRGLEPQIVASQTGRALDRHAAAETIVRALASLQREPVGLPVRVDRPKVTADELQGRPGAGSNCPVLVRPSDARRDALEPAAAADRQGSAAAGRRTS